MIAVFLGLVFVRQYFSPKEFVWQESYDKYSRQPFGSYVFDDVVSSSVESYEVVEKTFYSYYYD
ncbi:MAG: DUF4350 domain-containing protein, partial [Tannerella sp.]|nr:DUF4350 domain-containing protein [Tannerella sp.]